MMVALEPTRTRRLLRVASGGHRSRERALLLAYAVLTTLLLARQSLKKQEQVGRSAGSSRRSRRSRRSSCCMFCHPFVPLVHRVKKPHDLFYMQHVQDFGLASPACKPCPACERQEALAAAAGGAAAAAAAEPSSNEILLPPINLLELLGPGGRGMHACSCVPACLALLHPAAPLAPSAARRPTTLFAPCHTAPACSRRPVERERPCLHGV